MTGNAILQFAVFLILLVALSVPLGGYLARVYSGEAGLAERVLGPIERGFYRLAGVQPEVSMSWKNYALSVLVFHGFGALLLYGLLRIQELLPLNPGGMPAVSPEIAFNTAVSFVTNTNWQAYAGETTMSHLSQMLGLTVQNFLSAGTGMAVAVALIRGFSGQSQEGVGNFWRDLLRGTLYVLLPLSLVFAIVLVGLGVTQTLAAHATIHTLEGAEQLLALGPVASQEAIKLLGTNGGGFFNANSGHPFENPSALSNFLEMLAILILPVSFCFAFGRLVKSPRHGWVLLAAMLVLFVPLSLGVIAAEQAGNPKLAALVAGTPDRAGARAEAASVADLGSLEGKELRFGVTGSSLFAAVTTAASCGAVNAKHDSFTPLGGLIPMVLMQLGEIVFGGVGTGLYGMLMVVIIAVFISGLMVGRTPEFLSKKIEAYEMKMASLVILIPAASILVGTALAVTLPEGTATLGNPGAHGFSEVLYAITSGAANNGSAFAGLDVSGGFYTTLIGIAMWLGRFFVIVAVLAVAGSLANKHPVPASAGTLPAHTPLFAGLLVGTIVLVGALTFIPALALGPIVEQLQLLGH